MTVRRGIIVISLVILVVGSAFIVLRSIAPGSTNLLERLRQRFQDLTDDELQQLLEARTGRFGLLGNVNWILLGIGGIVTVVGFLLRTTEQSPDFKIGY
jgi:hypothetical protein